MFSNSSYLVYLVVWFFLVPTLRVGMHICVMNISLPALSGKLHAIHCGIKLQNGKLQLYIAGEQMNNSWRGIATVKCQIARR